MSKLTTTLSQHVRQNLHSLTIEFDAQLLDRDLLAALANYLSTDVVAQQVEMAFSIVAARQLDDRRHIVEQLRYQAAHQLVTLLARSPLGVTPTWHRVAIPRWMILAVGSAAGCDFAPVTTTEAALNMVLGLCVEFLERILGSDGEATTGAGRAIGRAAAE
ncbi:MAG: hypothetical protein HC838_05610 [Spirulinaceae cyanobacterium RM2_2_10]|nr:hypothetical protein [Spirulinaceae cyanobacterium SM2_1_0]NJO19639.1 hypothetical protein [Spirulinaceae cyanobacterium RM2_2_10]